MRFKVWCPDRGETIDDAREIDATYPDSAAESWADWSDWHGAEFSIVGGRDVTVLVSADEGSHAQSFVVSGESVRSYRARESSNAVVSGRRDAEGGTSEGG